MQKRLGFVGIALKIAKKVLMRSIKFSSDFGEIIIARTPGCHSQQKKCCVITLVIDATTE
jgi:hypothetical protein